MVLEMGPKYCNATTKVPLTANSSGRMESATVPLATVVKDYFDVAVSGKNGPQLMWAGYSCRSMVRL